MRVLIDTNVLLDFLCRREPFCADAEAVFKKGLSGEIKICICGLSFVNALYTTRKYGVPKDACVASLKSLLTFCDVTDINKEIVINTLNSGWADLEDALQFQSGRASGIDCIVTRDKKGFNDAKISVFSPAEFLKRKSK